MNKKFIVTSILLSLILTVSLFSGCAKEVVKEEPTKTEEATVTTDTKEEPSTEKAEAKEPIVWKFGHITNEDHVWNKTAVKFAELVAEKTNGAIEIKIYPNSQLGAEIDILNMIQSGAADLTISGESMANWAPKAALMAVPYAFTSVDQMVKVIDSELGAEIAQQITDNISVMPIYYHVRAPRNLTSNEPIRTPEDAKGLKMRVPNVPLFLNVWSEVGAQPQVMAFAEVFTGLQQGVIDAQENPYDLIYSAGFYEVQKYVNETEHVNQWAYVVLGKEQFDSLTPELQASVLEAAAEAQEFGNGLFESEIADYKQKIQDEGMTIISDVDKAAFQAAMQPAIEKTLTAEQYDLYQRMISFK